MKRIVNGAKLAGAAGNWHDQIKDPVAWLKLLSNGFSAENHCDEKDLSNWMVLEFMLGYHWFIRGEDLCRLFMKKLL